MQLTVHLKPVNLAQAVRDKEIGILTQVPGVGKKIAERLCLELKDKLDVWLLENFPAYGQQASSDFHGGRKSEVLSALMNLGYPRQGIDRVLGRIALKEDDSLQDWIRTSLKLMTQG
jgi:Holliday junction DNA helicase RuvA